MARSKKKNTPAKKADVIEDIVEAEIVETEENVDEIASEIENGVEVEEAVDDEIEQDDDVAMLEDDEVVENDVVAPTQETVVVKKNGFFSTVAGGALAAVLGFGAGQYLVPEGWPFPNLEPVNPTLQQQSDKIAELESIVATRVGQDDVSALRTDLTATVNTVVSDVDQKIASLTDQISKIGTSQSGEVTSSELQAQVAALQAELGAIASDAKAREDAAAAAELIAATRVSMAGVETALDTGANFSEHLDSLANLGVAVPPVLQELSTGVTPISELQNTFPSAARSALAAARDGAGVSAGGIGDFIKSQLGARSVRPKEGSDPDAVLSRAEAAINEQRLNDALAEIDALPDIAKSAMSDWTALAGKRQRAKTAFDALNTSLNSQ